MKKAIVLALAFVSFQSAFAAQRVVTRNDRIELPMCLKDLDNANRNIINLQTQLNSCLDLARRTGDGRGNGRGDGRIERENAELRDENRRLNDRIFVISNDNKRLFDENFDLRRQLDDLQNGGRGRNLGFFSYAGCKNSSGSVNLSYIVSSEGLSKLEAETKAKQKLITIYSCSYGVTTGQTEEIQFADSRSYCVAGCQNSSGSVNESYIETGTGRNVTEASYNALKAVTNKYSCSYGVKVQTCQ
ncbi:MAG: hypothetical protein WC635_10505 [Bacteriovorax sp.]|jgi:hypothetical protein